MPDTQPKLRDDVCLSLDEPVLQFMVHARAVYFAWACVWLREITSDRYSDRHIALRHLSKHIDVKHHSHVIGTLIETLYTRMLQRNPTVPEWTLWFIRYHTEALSPTLLRTILLTKADAKQLYQDDFLVPLKPYWSWYQLAGRDSDIALQDYARAVGRAFLSHYTESPEKIVTDSTDWTNEQNITRAIRTAFDAAPRCAIGSIRKWCHHLIMPLTK